jgi:two-component system KDP operon response regulator KdpE
MILSGSRVLVVDDEDDVRLAVSTVLRRDGLQVHLAEDGASALNAIFQNTADLIVLDLGLTDADGLDLLRVLRQSSNVPILVLSARVQADDRADALACGADAFMGKPFDNMELVEKVRELIAEGSVGCG